MILVVKCSTMQLILILQILYYFTSLKSVQVPSELIASPNNHNPISHKQDQQAGHHHHHHHHHQRNRKKERGKYINDSITAEDLYNTYEEVRNEYDECAFGNKNWQVLRRSGDSSNGNDDDDEIEIAIMQHAHDSSCPYVRMTATMPGGIEDVWDFLQLHNWDRTMPKMDPFYEGLTMIKSYKYRKKTGSGLFGGEAGVVSMELARKRTKRLLTFGKRDFTFVSVSDIPMNEGVWVSGTISIISDKLLPRKKGYTRGFQDSIAFYEAIPSSDDDNPQKRTKLTMIFKIDLNDSGEGGDGGSIPMWLYIKTVGTTGLLSISNMRKQLELDMIEKACLNEKKS